MAKRKMTKRKRVQSPLAIYSDDDEVEQPVKKMTKKARRRIIPIKNNNDDDEDEDGEKKKQKPEQTISNSSVTTASRKSRTTKHFEEEDGDDDVKVSAKQVPKTRPTKNNSTKKQQQQKHEQQQQHQITKPNNKINQTINVDEPYCMIVMDTDDDHDHEPNNAGGGLSKAGFRVEYSKTGRATCRRCDARIYKGQLRVANCPLFRGSPGYTVYRHLQCATFSKDVTRPSHIAGSQNLRPEDYTQLEKRIHESLKELEEENKALDPDELVQTSFTGEIRPPPPGLTANLLPFQVEGFSWMRHQEVVEDNLRGGILADEMGMGKTLQTICTILDHRPKLQHSLPNTKYPPSSDIKALQAEEQLWNSALCHWNYEMEVNDIPKSILPQKKKKSADAFAVGGARAGTLVVCPVIALTQWKSEIEKFTDGNLTVCIYHGHDRKTSMPRDILRKFDIVLTTYQVIEADMRKMISPNKVKCPNCGKKFKIDKLHVHLKYFCGEAAERTEAQARTRRQQPGGNNVGGGGGGSSGNKKGKKKDKNTTTTKTTSVTKNKKPSSSKNKKNTTTTTTKRTLKVKGSGDFDSESEISLPDEIPSSTTRSSSSGGNRRPSRKAAKEATKQMEESRKSWADNDDDDDNNDNDDDDDDDAEIQDDDDDDESIDDFNSKVSSSFSSSSRGKSNTKTMTSKRKKRSRSKDDSEDDDDGDDDLRHPNKSSSSRRGGAALARAQAKQAEALKQAQKGKTSKTVKRKAETNPKKVSKKDKTPKGKGKNKNNKTTTTTKKKNNKKKSFRSDSDSDISLDSSSDNDDDDEEIDIDALMKEATQGAQMSVLHSLCWWRIVLDEAHMIKRRSTQTAQAAFALIGIHRWCLSGTPLQNRVGEFYSLIRFLRIDPMAFYFCKVEGCDCKSLHYLIFNGKCKKCGHGSVNHFAHFNKHVLNPIQRDGYSGDGRRAMFVLKNEILDKCLFRRTKDTKADDMKLPPRIVSIRSVRLHPVEEDFYNALYTQTRSSFDDYVAEGTVLNNYAHIFDLLMRMRQAVCHPYLVVHWKKAASVVGSSGPVVVANGTVECEICHEPPMEQVLSTCCGSGFCRNCVLEYMETCTGLSSGNEQTPCPSCRAPFSIDLSKTRTESNEDDPFGGGSKAKTERISAAGMPSLKDLSNVATGSILRRIDLTHFATSTKIEALAEELVKMRQNSPGSKAIVFSQFVNMLDLIRWRLHSDPCLADMGLGVKALHGGMNVKARDESLRAFREDGNTRVLLMSLKAGGVALNLTVANHIYLMDPWWNPAAEMQAIDRTHRLGQYRPIRAIRFIAEDTVEERILQLQEKKRLVFDGTVGRDAGSLAMLTADDMKALFN